MSTTMVISLTVLLTIVGMTILGLMMEALDHVLG